MLVATPISTSSPWLISRGQDLTWFLGPSLISYAAIAALALGVPAPLLFFAWIFLLDGPHVIATATRTYIDDQQRRRLGLLLWVIVPAVLMGPILVGLGLGQWFLFFAISWQAWHVAKQHFGFVMLYKAKNQERVDFLLDKWTLLGCSMIPFACFWLSTKGISIWYMLVAYLVLIGAFVVRQVQKWANLQPLNVPKLLLFVCVLPLQWVAFAHAVPFGVDGAIRMAMAGGIFHSLQYHRLILFHNRNRYAGSDAPLMAAFFSHNLLAYLCLVIGLYGVVAYVGSLSLSLQAATWGVAFSHYILDSRIWRVREDKDLAVALRLAPA
jgi:hypothetical protein